MDTYDEKTRSKVMRAVKSEGNKSTEIALIRLFKKYKLSGWRRNYKLIGSPDFVFTAIKIIVFADGCFWHGCKCKKMPSSNEEYWKNKIEKNVKRDRWVSSTLRRNGWSVYRVKECQISKGKLPARLLSTYALKSPK